MRRVRVRRAASCVHQRDLSRLPSIGTRAAGLRAAHARRPGAATESVVLLGALTKPAADGQFASESFLQGLPRSRNGAGALVISGLLAARLQTNECGREARFAFGRLDASQNLPEGDIRRARGKPLPYSASVCAQHAPCLGRRSSASASGNGRRIGRRCRGLLRTTPDAVNPAPSRPRPCVGGTGPSVWVRSTPSSGRVKAMSCASPAGVRDRSVSGSELERDDTSRDGRVFRGCQVWETTAVLGSPRSGLPGFSVEGLPMLITASQFTTLRCTGHSKRVDVLRTVSARAGTCSGRSR